MAGWGVRPGAFTPRRRRGTEVLDDPGIDPALRRRSHRDIERSNTWLGGYAAVEAGVRDALRDAPPGPLVLLDVGAGRGLALLRMMRLATTGNRPVHPLGLDIDPELVRDIPAPALGICGSACALPLADKSVDIVTCSLLLHHFDTAGTERVVRELDRVARHRVIVHDLRRSWVAVAGLWLLSFPLGFHAVSRHDGMLSILRGFTAPELAALVVRVTGTRPRVQGRWAYRLLASWRPAEPQRDRVGSGMLPVRSGARP